MKQGRVLIVEDDRCLYQAVVRGLRSVNRATEIVWVTNVEEAEQILMTEDIRLVISDYTLCGFKTGLDFWTTCQSTHPKIPFVMMSGLPVQDFLRLVDGEVPPPMLPKPFSMTEFSSFVGRFL